MKKLKHKITLEQYLNLGGKIENLNFAEANAKCTYPSYSSTTPNILGFDVISYKDKGRVNDIGAKLYEFELNKKGKTYTQILSLYWVEIDVNFILDEKYTK